LSLQLLKDQGDFRDIHANCASFMPLSERL
jgi:hypothetical protein